MAKHIRKSKKGGTWDEKRNEMKEWTDDKWPESMEDKGDIHSGIKEVT
jgi:hypothetical protein